ncbi:MAG: sulfatase-like hydrolase/transferase, partial [Gemmatimonadetes bacterium]|nr:sulfatase-like hydrolase/transferase [Gemmatimonadota bacterium]
MRPASPASVSPFPRLAPRDIVAAVVLVAAFGGLSESAVTWIRAWRLYEPTDLVVGPEALWTGPLAALLVLLPIALGLLVVDRLAPRLQVRRVIVPLVAFAAAYSLIIGARVGIGSWPARMLAAGIAAGIGRLLTRDGVRQRLPLRRMAVAVATTLFLAGLVIPVQRAARERLAMAGLAKARPGAPNVVVLIWDTARAASLTPWGAPADVTPTLAALATKGLTYDRAFAPASWSLPSHASMFTGRWPHELTASYRAPLDGTPLTIGEAMQQRGYVTASMTANLFFGRSTFGLARGFQHYDDRPELSPQSIGQSWYVARRILEKARDRFGDHHQSLVRRSAEQINTAFLDWVDQRPGDRPFLAVLNQFDAHEPYLPP